MTLDQVISSIENTILGKRELLDGLGFYTGGNGQSERATAELIRTNISELERILADLKRVKEAAAAAGWQGNPDRMGGCYTEEEVARATEWR
jgi:hypothetical protein